jgi:hypothetical protein
MSRTVWNTLWFTPSTRMKICREAGRFDPPMDAAVREAWMITGPATGWLIGRDIPAIRAGPPLKTGPFTLESDWIALVLSLPEPGTTAGIWSRASLFSAIS